MNSPWRLPCSTCWKTGVPPTWAVICGAIVVQIGFGLYPVVVQKYATKNKADPVVFSFYRDMCCFPVLFLCSFVAERKFLIPRPGILFLFVVLGLLGMFGNQLLFILGVYWAGADIASAIQPVIPVWTYILVIVTCTEKFPLFRKLHSWMKVVAIILAAGGAVEITLTGYKSTTSGGDNDETLRVLGYVSLLGNTFCMAVYVLLQKKFIFDKPECLWRDYPVAITAYSYFFGAVFMGLAAVISTTASGNIGNWHIPSESTYALVYAIFITSALCYLLITWANMHLPSTLVTAFWPVQVLVAVVVSYFVLGEKLAPFQYVGALLIIIGLFLLLLSNHMDEREAEGGRVIMVDCCCPPEKEAEEEDCDDVKPLMEDGNPKYDYDWRSSTSEMKLSSEEHRVQ